MVFFFQAEDGIRDLVRSRGLGDVYKRQEYDKCIAKYGDTFNITHFRYDIVAPIIANDMLEACLLYTSDAADDLLCVDLGGRRIIKKKKKLTKLSI